MPNHVINEVRFVGLADETRQNLIAKLIGDTGDVDFEQLLPIPINYWMGNVGSIHSDTFPGTAIDWCTNNWSTKWNAYESECDKDSIVSGLVLRFKTAWRPPYGWLVAIFNTFEISFEYRWLSEGRDKSYIGIFDYEQTKRALGEPWKQIEADELTHRYLHKLLWGVENFSEDGDADH